VSVTRDQVLHVAALARLQLADAEVVQLTIDLNGILAHMSALEGADVAGVEGAGGAAEWPAPLRADEPVVDPLQFPPAALSAHWQSGFFTVPTLPAHDPNSP
jgi:aspartyl-tRNA(Asn)/glutamyl-tRNA(Gln) amidotransferase subunit C